MTFAAKQRHEHRHDAAAQRVTNILGSLVEKLPGKVRAYGAAHEIQPRLLMVLMEQYIQDDGTYAIPAYVLTQIPRITRVLDRIIRVASTDDGIDPLAENPWWDAAGDCVAGAAQNVQMEDF